MAAALTRSGVQARSSAALGAVRQLLGDGMLKEAMRIRGHSADHSEPFQKCFAIGLGRQLGVHCCDLVMQ